ncbi:MAG: T9SS type A sorting domain-containing protein, partial [Cytophagales bacterium]
PAGNTLKMRQVDAGSGNTGIALACDGSVWTWGGNCQNGNIGNGLPGGFCGGSGGTDGDAFYSELQRVVGGAQGGAFLTNIVYINASTRTSFAVENTGRVLAWGNNQDGDLGRGTSGNAGNTYTPSYVLTAAGTPLTNIKMVEGTDFGGYALSNDGFVYSWGGNTNQDLGRAIAGDQFFARRVRAWDYSKNDGSTVDLSNIVKITGGDTHGLAIDADGNVWSWGGDWGPGQRGWGATSTAVPYATRVVAPGTPCALNQWRIGPWLTGAIEITAGQQHSIVLLNDGRVVTFGNNTHGQLGNGSTTSSGCPVYVMTNATTQLQNIVAISDGDLWSFALNSAGQVYVFGQNNLGQLGIPGNTTNQTYAFLNPAIPTSCGSSILPCPIASLGSDITKCEGEQVTLLAGANGDTYLYTWFFSNSPTGPWTQIGAANRTYNNGLGARLDVTIPRYYRVTITDTRAYVADQCGPCALSEDVIRVQDREPPLAASDAGVCSDDVCFEITSTGAVDNTAFDWYANLTTTTKLNTSGFRNPFCTNKSNLTLNGGNYEIWVDDKRSFQARVGPTSAPCTPPTGSSGGSSFTKYQQQMVVFRDVTINEVSLYYRTYNVSATPDNVVVRVYSNDPNKNSSSNDGVNALTGQVSSIVSIPRISTNFQLVTLTNLNLSLTGTPSGTKYWLEVAPSGGANGEFFDFTCAASYPYADDIVGEDAIVLRGSTESAQVIQQANYRAFTFNWKFTYQSGYPCGRFKVIAPDNNTACLPVSFMSFKGEKRENGNYLEWVTSFEANSSFFEILRSVDGKKWETIGQVNSTGNTDFATAYQYTDFKPLESAYYKIREIGIYGESTNSNIVYISGNPLERLIVEPNPTSGMVYLNLPRNNELESLSVSVQDLQGKEWKKIGVNKGESSRLEIDMTYFSDGLYLLIIESSEYQMVKKIVKN